MSNLIHLLLDRLTSPIGTMMLVCDTAGRLRVAFFAEDEEPVRRQLVRQFGAYGFLVEATRNPHGLTDWLRKDGAPRAPILLRIDALRKVVFRG